MNLKACFVYTDLCDSQGYARLRVGHLGEKQSDTQVKEWFVHPVYLVGRTPCVKRKRDYVDITLGCVYNNMNKRKSS